MHPILIRPQLGGLLGHGPTWIGWVTQLYDKSPLPDGSLGLGWTTIGWVSWLWSKGDGMNRLIGNELELSQLNDGFNIATHVLLH